MVEILLNRIENHMVAKNIDLYCEKVISFVIVFVVTETAVGSI